MSVPSPSAVTEPIDVSVVLCTYNRCDLLPRALESLLTQDADEVRYEVVVVDNNSTDRTREVIEGFVARHPATVRYLFEGKQGLSHARNTGIASARGPIVAFTDDDVRAGRDWIRKIKQALDRHPEADFVGGKVLPRWGRTPPPWLTPEHWSPLALVDYGDAPFHVNDQRPLCLVAANLAVRREVFERVGPFSAEVQRVGDGIGSLDEAELLLRVRQSGGQGVYVPTLIMIAEVQPERLTAAYHRRWHAGHGRSHARLRAPDFERSRARLFDVPAHLYRSALTSAWRWLGHRLRGRGTEAFLPETRLCFFVGFFRQRLSDRRADAPGSPKPSSESDAVRPG